ncbi:MAG TPA: hypothetical protein VLL50_12625 [Usitatibacter sp.]|nr:hypothetical protein [Usitatibacter sp.]
MIAYGKDWIASARFAASETELLRLANEFIATWSREQLAALPGDCRMHRIESLEGIGDLAFALVRHECSLEPLDHPAILQAMAQFFASASTRGAELRAWKRGFRPFGIPSIASSRP